MIVKRCELIEEFEKALDLIIQNSHRSGMDYLTIQYFMEKRLDALELQAKGEKYVKTI